MENLTEYLETIKNPAQKARFEEVFHWIGVSFPMLIPKIAWNQPMYTDHGTFIVGFSAAKQHMAVAPEKAGISHFIKDIEAAGYDYTKELIRIPWNKSVDYALLKKIIDYNIGDKADYSAFWRK